MKTPILETERVVLRPLRLDDAETIFKSWTSDPDVAKYMVWDLHKSVEETIEWLNFEVDNIDNPEVYTWGFELKETGELIGSGGMIYRDDKEMYSIGYNFMKKYWRQGFGTEVAEKMLDFIVNEIGAKEVFGQHESGNDNSGKVMKKLGFEYMGEGEGEKFSGEKRIFCEYIYKAK